MDLLSDLRLPVISAPMAGGVATPELVAAVGSVGGLGLLGGGYLTADGLRRLVARTRGLTDTPFGVNLFVPDDPGQVDTEAIAAYRERLRPEAERFGVTLGEPAWSEDHWTEKVEALLADPVPVVSFTFGCPEPDVIDAFRAAGSRVVVSVTTPGEARQAEQAGADALCAQGFEAGGHRASFDAASDQAYGLLALVTRLRRTTRLPIIAAGGVADRPAVRAALAAGAVAVQVGTAFLRSPESGAHALYKRALVDPAYERTMASRAYTGRLARGLANRFLLEHSPYAPVGYPQLHRITAPLRAPAAKAEAVDSMFLLAGQNHALAEERPAAEIALSLGGEL